MNNHRISMKRTQKILVFLLSMFILTSCVRVETVIRVNKDGSGTITETVMMSKVFADMMRSFSESFGEPGTEEMEKKEFSLFDKEKLAKEASDFGENVTYQSGMEVKEKDWEGYTAVYSFDDIEKIKLNTSQEDKVDTGMSPPTSEKEESDREFYSFVFKGGKRPTLLINRNEIDRSKKEEGDNNLKFEDMEESSDELSAMTEEMSQMFTGMRFTMKVEVDGKIVETNASYRDGSAITLMDMDMGEMMKNKQAFSELTSQKPETTEELRVFMEKFEGLKLELEKPVSINFK